MEIKFLSEEEANNPTVVIERINALKGYWHAGCEMVDVMGADGQLMFTKDGERISCPREVAHLSGFWHCVMVVSIITVDNQVVFEERAQTVEKNPGKLDLVTGHLKAGLDSIGAVAKEVAEEIWLNFGRYMTTLDYRFKGAIRKVEEVSPTHLDRHHFHIYVVRRDDLRSVEDLGMQTAEVANIKFVNFFTLKAMLENPEGNNLVERPGVYELVMEELQKF